MDLPAKLFSMLARSVNFLRFFYSFEFLLVKGTVSPMGLAFDDMFGG
jgi:hypothetical protein